jgi:hypothetical protein
MKKYSGPKPSRGKTPAARSVAPRGRGADRGESPRARATGSPMRSSRTAAGSGFGPRSSSGPRGAGSGPRGEGPPRLRGAGPARGRSDGPPRARYAPAGEAPSRARFASAGEAPSRPRFAPGADARDPFRPAARPERFRRDAGEPRTRGFTVTLDPDVARVFRGDASVNKALRLVMQLVDVVQGPPARGAPPRRSTGYQGSDEARGFARKPRFEDDDTEEGPGPQLVDEDDADEGP